jgi:ABC-2 type transport system permease protein
MTCTLAPWSWDLSENRMNSFSRSEEKALQQLRGPLVIEVHLAPEDPRRVDLDRRVLSKLRRIVPELDVRYVSATDIGLFEQSNPHYGEITYTFNGHSATSRAITPEAVLEAIFTLAGATSMAEGDDDIFRGHPLAVKPKGAAIVFYIVWPAVVVICGIWVTKRNR